MISQQLRQPDSTDQWCAVSLNRLQNKTALPRPEADIWVKLLEPLNPYCEGDALLLCPLSNGEWAAWTPSQGETVINTTQFCIPQI